MPYKQYTDQEMTIMYETVSVSNNPRTLKFLKDNGVTGDFSTRPALVEEAFLIEYNDTHRQKRMEENEKQVTLSDRSPTASDQIYYNGHYAADVIKKQSFARIDEEFKAKMLMVDTLNHSTDREVQKLLDKVNGNAMNLDNATIVLEYQKEFNRKHHHEWETQIPETGVMDGRTQDAIRLTQSEKEHEITRDDKINTLPSAGKKKQLVGNDILPNTDSSLHHIVPAELRESFENIAHDIATTASYLAPGAKPQGPKTSFKG